MANELDNPKRRRRRKQKDPGFYKHAVRVLRHGFLDTVETDEYDVTPGTSKTEAIRQLKEFGYPIGKEIDYNERTGVLIDVRRTGNLARGFDAKDGYNLAEIDQWTPAQKAKVTRLFKVVSRLSSRPFQIYRPRKPENLERVQRAAQHHEFPPELAVAFVPVGRPGERAKIDVRADRVVITERSVSHTPTLWGDVGLTMKDVAADPVAAVRKVIEHTGGKYFTLLAGTTEFRRTFQAEGLEQEILRVMNAYDEEWQNFLFGIQAFDMPQGRDLRDYRKSKREAKDAQDRYRKHAKRVFRRMYGSKKKRSKRK